MPGPRLSDVAACVFDAYGTLFDLASATQSQAGALGDRLEPLARRWRQKQLEYTWLRSLMGAHADFWQVTGDSLDVALAEAGIRDEQLRTALLQSYLDLAPYPEVPPMLAQLAAAGRRCAILSNGTPAMLDTVLSRSGLGSFFAAVLSVEAAGVYKPHPSVYQLAVDALGLPAARICFVSANGWDAAGAARFGFRVVWVNRTAAIEDRLPARPEVELATLAGLPALLGSEDAHVRA